MLAGKFIYFISIIIFNFLIFSHGYDPDEKTLERKFGKLVHVSAIFRHGERAPFVTYPHDPHKHYPWPDGLSQLLKTGKLRLYNLGKWFRKQYKDLLNSIHSHTRMMVESSDTDRTIMSAQYFMASFYEPNMTQRISKYIRWQPIPIHTSSVTEENYIWMYVSCPREKFYAKKFFGTSKMKKKYDEHKKTFDYIQRHTGIKFFRNDLYKASWSIYNILDILQMEESQNLTLPSWTKKVYPKTLEKLYKIFVHREIGDSKILPFKTGPIMKSIIADMESAKNLTNNSRKIFHFYSGHDTTVVAMMYALGNFNGVNPPFGSAIVLEIRNKGKDNFVVARFKSSPKSTFKQLDIAKCGKPCTVEKFIKMTSPLMVKNWKLECQMESRKNETVHEDS